MMMTNETSTVQNFYESPTSGRRWGWLAEVNHGQVPAEAMRPRHAQAWFDEDVAAVKELAKSRPGHPLAVSVHATNGASGSSLRKRKADPRWTSDPRLTMTTRTLYDPDLPNASAIVVIYSPEEVSSDN